MPRSSLTSGLDILALLESRPHAMRLTDIADQIGLSKSGTHKVLATLCERGVVEHTLARTYRLAHSQRREAA